MTPALWSIALVRILLAQLAFGFSWCLYLVAPKFLATELKLGPSEIGSVGMTSGAVSAISVLLIVRSIDHSRRTLFVRGCALLSLSSLLYVFVERFGPIVYLLSAGISVSYALAFNAAMASVTDVVPEARLGQAFGLQSAANLSMNAVSSMTAEHIAQHYGWRWVFASAAVGSIGSLLLGLGLPRARVHKSPDSPSLAPPYRTLAPVFFVSSLLGATYVALATFHQPYALALGVDRVSSFFVGFTLGALLMRLGFGSLGDRFGRKRVAAVSLFLYALVAASMSRLDPSRLWLYGAGFGVAHGIAYPTLIAVATERVPKGTQGRIIAAFSGAFNLGTSIGAMSWGALSAGYGYPYVFVAAGMCMLSACACLLLRSDGSAAAPALS